MLFSIENFRYPFKPAKRFQALRVFDYIHPCSRYSIAHEVDVGKDTVAQMLLTHLAPYQFRWIQLRRFRGKMQKRHIARDGQASGSMPPRLVAHKNGLDFRMQYAGEIIEIYPHALQVRIGKKKTMRRTA